MRTAIIRGQADKLVTIQRYLPSNYMADLIGDHVKIVGEDSAGWTLDGYVIPRLASGMFYAKEVEKMYLVHSQCGEAFDSMDIAALHECDGSGQTEWELLPESEAM